MRRRAGDRADGAAGGHGRRGTTRHRCERRCDLETLLQLVPPESVEHEQDDLARHTSSSSTKLIHGGLRYLEYYEFSLVKKALAEREVLLKSAPHIMWPLRFVMPHDPAMRPAWMIRALNRLQGAAQRQVLGWLVRRAQSQAEARAWQARQQTLQQDRELARLIGFAGRVT